uniref:Uncharacterized protein n=1 Tax=Romanomermis culicivorax TaxID=13658 RepID=A0A915KQS2_ROMCU
MLNIIFGNNFGFRFCSAKAAEVFTNFTLSILDDDEALCRNNITIKQNPFQDPNDQTNIGMLFSAKTV